MRYYNQPLYNTLIMSHKVGRPLGTLNALTQSSTIGSKIDYWDYTYSFNYVNVI